MSGEPGREIVVTDNAIQRIGPAMVVLTGFLVVWYGLAALLGEAKRAAILPYPHTVVTDVWPTTVDCGEFLCLTGGGPSGVQPSQLLAATALTLAVAVLGLILAMVLGIGCAVVMSQYITIERGFYPYAIILQAVPILTLVPLFGLLFGFGVISRIIVVVIISIFPVITNTLFGLGSVDEAHHDLFGLYNATKWDRLTKLQLPAALPAMVIGFQIASGLAVTGAIVGGLFFQRGPRDLGNRILLYSSRLRPGEMVAAVILSSLIGVVFFQFFGWVGNRVGHHRLEQTKP